MKLAISQIDVAQGDIQGACRRIADQIIIASRQGASVLLVPYSVFCGDGSLAMASYLDYEHDVLKGLKSLAAVAAEYDIACFVPAPGYYEDADYPDIYLMRDGRLVPLRLFTALSARKQNGLTSGSPTFDFDGVRLIVSFDFDHMTPPTISCDLAVRFATDRLDCSDAASCGYGEVQERYGEAMAFSREHHLWMASVRSLGACERSVYAGGSFVVDDAGEVVSAAPYYEESLLLCDVRRDGEPDTTGPELQAYGREHALWRALGLHVTDTVHARGMARASVRLSGDLASTALACLAVDALGPGNVVAVFIGREDALTPFEMRDELERAARVRNIAKALRIQLIARSVAYDNALPDADTLEDDRGRLGDSIGELCFLDVSRRLGALPLSSLTKTDYAFAACSDGLTVAGAIAPFGDIYLTELEFLARERMHASVAVLDSYFSRDSMGASYTDLLDRAIRALDGKEAYASRIRSALQPLTPEDIDGVLQAHVDDNRSFDDIELAQRNPEATSLILLLVRKGEASRCRLPLAPSLSKRSFSERAWPINTMWSDLGRGGDEPYEAERLAKDEIDRQEARGSQHMERVRGEILGMIGSMLGLTPEQLEEMQGSMREDVQDAPSVDERVSGEVSGQQGSRRHFDGAGPGGMMPGMRFFSQN